MKKQLIILLVMVGLTGAFFAGRAMDRRAAPPGDAQRSAGAAMASGHDHNATGDNVTGQNTGRTHSTGAKSTGVRSTGTKSTHADSASATVTRHPSRGPADALVTVVEISDFQCPFCRKGQDTLEALRKEHARDVRVVFINLPLDFHEHARAAAMAAMAAHRQGRFWPLDEKLFAGQRDLSPAKVTAMASAIGLDMQRFRKDLADPSLAEQISDDMAIANSLGVSGTPAYFINGVQISGAQPKEKLAAVLNAQLRQADELLQQGTPRNKLHLRMWRRNNPAKADVAIDWIIRGGTPPKSARPKPQKKAAAAQKVDGPTAKKAVHPAKDKTVWKVTLAGDEPSRGPADALLTLVLFTDFQCPFCSRVRPALAQVEKAYAGKVRLVFKNQPLSFHKQAPLAAEAGLCAHAQGKFWPMEAELFSHQRELAPDQLRSHAAAVGLNRAKFDACLTSHAQRPLLNRDVRLAAQLQVTGTPTVFINGRKVGGAQPYGVFARVIEQELARAKRVLAGGTPAKKLYGELIARGKSLVVRPEVGVKTFAFDTTGSPRLGSASARYQVVVFEDLQCPFCARLAPVLATVRAKLGERVSVVFKHLPLSNQCNAAMGRDMHPAACHAAFWAMAAQDQDRFWTFSKRIFGDLPRLMPAGDSLAERLVGLDINLRRHAKAAGVDVVKAEAYIKERRYATVLERDIREAAQLRVGGTPSVFINGREYNGPLAADRIVAAVLRVAKETAKTK